MKSTILLIIFILIYFCGFSTNYYISSSSGDDASTGTSAAQAWKTIYKINSFTFTPGDNIYFKRGDIFYGVILVNQSGSTGSPITYGAYSIGSNPVITGFQTVGVWTDLGFNVWQSTNEVSTMTDCNMVLINGVNTPMGRFPNSGWLTYQSSTSTSITSTSLNASTTNWTGAQAVIKKERYIIDRPVITSASGSTIGYTNPSWSSGNANWGFFIQNDTRTLDQQNEWYYNSTDKKLSVYSIGAPTNVKLATRDTLAYIVNKSYITFDGIDFTGANGQAFYLGNAGNVIIKNCKFDFNYNAISGKQFGGTSSNLLIDNCLFVNTNNNAIDLPSEFSGATITNNYIDSVALFEGMSESGQSRWGMNLTGDNYTIQNNTVKNVGYVSIGFNGSNILCDKNVIDSFCIVTDDGGAIYTGNPQTGVIISNNVITNGIGNVDGTDKTEKAAHGIYCDDLSSGMSILNNSIINISAHAIFLHQAKDIIVRGNNTYNARTGLFASNDNADTSYHTTGLEVKKNIFVAKTIGTIYTNANQLCINLASKVDDLAGYGIIDSNYYARPIDDNKSIWWTIYGDNDYKYTLEEWKDFSGYDLHSTKSPKSVDNTDSLIFVINTTDHDSTILLPYKYIDMESNSYDGSITLAPYTSKTLIQDGPAIIPIPTRTDKIRKKIRIKFINEN